MSVWSVEFFRRNTPETVRAATFLEAVEAAKVIMKAKGIPEAELFAIKYVMY